MESESTGIAMGWLTAFPVLAGVAWLLSRGKTSRTVAAAALAIVVLLAGAALWYLPQGEPVPNAEKNPRRRSRRSRFAPPKPIRGRPPKQ